MSAPDGFFRHNAFLIAAVALPVLVVMFFLLATALPRWTVPAPAYDSVLRVVKPYEQPGPHVSVEFRVNDGRLEAIARPIQIGQSVQSYSLLRFDHRALNVEELPVAMPDSLPDNSPSQAIAVNVSGRRVLQQARAPDGYELRTDTSRGGVGLMGDLFGMRGYDPHVVLVNKGRVVSLPLPSGYQYLSQVTTIGWLADAQ